MRQTQICGAVLFILMIPGLVCADAGPMVLFYDAPAAYQANITSNEALPIGNGRLAAMVYGGINTEVIQFNEDTVWSGSPPDPPDPPGNEPPPEAGSSEPPPQAARLSAHSAASAPTASLRRGAGGKDEAGAEGAGAEGAGFIDR